MTPDEYRDHVEVALKGACELIGNLKLQGAAIRES